MHNTRRQTIKTIPGLLHWIKNMHGLLVLVQNAGHNSNTDQPDEVNRLIEKFISEIDRKAIW